MSNWLQSFRLSQNPTQAGDFFGMAVSLNSAGNIALVGSSEDDGGSRGGSAYIFTGSATNWVQTAKITGSDKAGGDLFGSSVSINSVGNIAIVGAFREDPNGVTDAGSAYIFTGSGSNWVQTAKITGNDSATDDFFGGAVSLNSAGNIALVGAAGDDIGALGNVGSAYIFTGSGSNWVQVAKITGSDGTVDDFFGAAVSINSAGNVALIGAYYEDPNGVNNAGAAYIFTGSGSNWVQTAKITGSDAAADDVFGQSVSINSVGNIAIVAAQVADVNSVPSAGAAYIFTGSGSNWVQTAKITGSDAANGDTFGNSVSLNSVGNVAIIGAQNADPNGVDAAGAAYIFTGSGSNWVQVAKITGSGAAIQDYFGRVVSINSIGNIAIITAPYSDPNLVNVAGSAYIFTGFVSSEAVSSSSSSSSSFTDLTTYSGLFAFNNIQNFNKKIHPLYDTGIYNYRTGQINKDSQYIQKYLNIPVSGMFYSKLTGYRVLNDISFIPLKGYLGHIYTGLYSGKEPIEYETGIYGIPKVTGNIVLGENSYIDYKAKNYRLNPLDTYYQQFLPSSGEAHVLVLDLNLYGFEEDSIEDCDIELNATIIKTGLFHEIPKNPSILNFEVIDLKNTIGITDNTNDYIAQKRIMQNFESNNFINYDTSYYNNSDSLNLKYKFIKNQITISPPRISNNKNIALPCLFQYKSGSNNLSYNIGEYQFLVFKDNNYLQSGNYITGTQTGFLYFLSPGTYTTIISGNENDFLRSENSLSGKNQNIHLLSMDVNFVTGEKLQEIYIENQDKIWASYLLGQAELVSGSGYNSLNYQDPIAFAIDFERNLSGQVDSPSLFYREVTGAYTNLCTPKIIVVGIGEGCTTTFCLICDQASKLYNQGQTYIDVPKQYLPLDKYAAVLTYYEDPNPSTYRVALDASFIAQCCACKENGCQNLATSVQYNLDNPTLSQSGDAAYSGVFFLDNLNPATVNTKYNLNSYSGQIAVNSFYEGDKITFKQYTFDFEKVYGSLYGLRPAIKEYTTEFVFSNSFIGNNYFSGKQDLINKINYKFASSGLYSWKPLKYNKTPEFEYGPLMTGIDGGIDASGNNIVNLLSLRSGKFGSHDIKLILQPRLQVYNYLVPNIIKLEISDDFINWTGVVTS